MYLSHCLTLCFHFFSYDQPKATGAEGEPGSATPDWIKLAKRKTWAVDSGSEPAEPVVTTSVTTTEKYPAKPAVRQASSAKHDKPDMKLNELQNKLTQAKAKSESLPRDSSPNIAIVSPLQIDTDTDKDKPLLYASTGPVSPPGRAAERGPTVARRRSPYDNVMSESFGGFYAEKAHSPTNTDDNKSVTAACNKETIILPKPRAAPVGVSGSAAEECKENELPVGSADPPWKAALKQRTGRSAVKYKHIIFSSQNIHLTNPYFLCSRVWNG